MIRTTRLRICIPRFCLILRVIKSVLSYLLRLRENIMNLNLKSYQSDLILIYLF